MIPEVFRRFSKALIILILVILLMLVGTMLVMSLGDKMMGEIDTQMTPRGENILK